MQVGGKMKHEHDEGLLAVLAEAHSHALQFEGAIADSSDATTIWGKLRLALETHGLFGKGKHIFAGAHQLNLTPRMIAMVLYRSLLKRGPEGTLGWIHELFSVETIDSRRCAELIGVKIKEPLLLLNGVRLVPFEEMRSSWYADGLRCANSMPRSMMAEFPYDVIGMYQVASLKFSTDIENYRGDYQDLTDTALAVTVATSCAAVLGAAWSEYENTDYADAEIGWSHMPALYEGRSPRFQDITLDASHFEDINRFLSLAGTAKKACLTASARLNSARRRITPGDSAIDLATALEALLATNDERSEITYRLKLRAALMLGDNFEERDNVFKLVGELYKLRSKVVHGSISTTSNATDIATVRWATDVCQQLLVMVVRAGRMPDLKKLVLIGKAEASFS